ncbi:MAG: SAM-dependent methyltransferase, partial [Gammaproteobacteria bacterium]|nr:SAM-dependent methyltransferase [Gammaproteobacteria bacterium]
GLNTAAWDISTVALSYLLDMSESRNLNIITENRDVTTNPPAPDSFDVIVVANFLDRSIIPDIISALRQDGLVYYQTFTKSRTKKPAPDNPLYKLDMNELLQLFDKLTVRYYREDGYCGTDDECQGLAMLVAQKTIITAST